MHSPFGPFKAALLAAPPSPLKLALPVPAYVVMMPVDAVILRTRWLLKSLKYTFPLASMSIPCGELMAAEVAWPLSPE